MTLNDLEDALLEHFNYNTEESDSAARRRMRRHLNWWQRRILTTPGLEKLREGTISFASVASTATYAFTNAVSRILRVYETSNDTILEGRGPEWYRLTEPDPNTGLPEVYVPLGDRPVSAQPASTGLWAVSSSASDTTGQVRVEYVRSGGIIGSATGTINGTTRVALGSDTDIVEVSKFYLSSRKVGAVALYNASTAGTALGVIQAGRIYSRYYTLALWPTPSAAITYYVDYEREVADMEHGTDEPMLPGDFHQLLELGARISEYEKQEDSRRAAAEVDYARLIGRLVARQSFPAGAVFVPGELTGRRLSRLGPWYPKGS